MSIQARRQLIDSPATFFQHEAEQHADLMDPAKTQTELIALLLELVGKGHVLEFTAIRSDHSDDSCLGYHSHADGFCADLWPLASRTAGDYLDASDDRFAAFLADAARSHWLYQIGLAGSADTRANQIAAGRTEFPDDGADHVHLGANSA